ncbi:hypothetical protein P7C73_g2798, partial [Tremellales sp. Uapishka_1]
MGVLQAAIAAQPLTSAIGVLASLGLLYLLRSPALPSRDIIIPPQEDRVLLLGASSGVGRDLAIAYAKRGAYICLVARRKESLETVRRECIAVGAKEDKILVVPANITSAEDLLRVRATVIREWKRLDTLHVLAGVPSTLPLLQIAGVALSPSPDSTKLHFNVDGQAPLGDMPNFDGLAKVAEETRACAEINYVGTVLALACFLPLLATTSAAPALHHLSSVAATVPAPCRTIYASSKAAALMAVESCRVECEGCGVRFFSLLPGTIANDFRTKSASSETGGRDETRLDIDQPWEKLLLSPERVVKTILHHLSLNPHPQPLIPYPPFSLFRALDQPPKHLVHLPWQYRFAMFVRDTPLGWGYIEPQARRKYGLRP